MEVFFFCNNHCADFSKTYTELCHEEVIRFCPYCGGKLHIQNLEEILHEDIKKQVENYFKEALTSLGLEGTIEAIEHLQNKQTKKLYQDELRYRGLIK